jgi:SnoaL-like domain
VGDNSSIEDRLRALEARVEELENERAIREVLSRYGYTADTCNDELFVDLYTDNGAIRLSRRGSEDAHQRFSEWRGRDEVRRFITNPMGHHSPQLYGKSMHINDNVVTHIDGDRAVVNSYQFAIVDDEHGVKLLSAGNNQWQLRKVDGTWLIEERRGAYLGDEFFTTNMDATPD